eukprot:6180212-Alexandrium_andersonii.AAC.1
MRRTGLLEEPRGDLGAPAIVRRSVLDGLEREALQALDEWLPQPGGGVRGPSGKRGHCGILSRRGRGSGWLRG